MSYFLDPAIRVEIYNDYDLVSEFLKWLCDHPEVESFRGGSSGRGNLIQWFPAEQEDALNKFFAGRPNVEEIDDDF